TIAKIHADTRRQLIDAEKVDPPPALLGTSEESVRSFALGDGGILTILRRASFSSKTGVTADIELEGVFRFFYHPPGTFDVEHRVACTSILGGQLEQASQHPRFRLAAAGDALVVDDRHEPHLWLLDKQGACAFRDLGPVPYAAGERNNVGIPHHSGAVARVRSDGDDGAVLEVVSPGKAPEVVFATDNLALGQPVWLDDRHLALRANLRDRKTTDILFVSRDHPGQQLLYMPEFLGVDDPSVVSLVARPGASSTELIAVVDSRNTSTQLINIKLEEALAERFAAVTPPAALAETGPPTPEPQNVAKVENPEEPENPEVLVEQTPEELEAAALARELALLQAEGVAQIPGSQAAYQSLYEDGGLHSPSVSADGQTVAFVVYGRGGTEIAAIRLDGSAPVVVTGNEVADRSPTVTADGNHVVFNSRYKLRNTTWIETAGRAVKLPAPIR
ncbi:MAG: TolB family protein, partial [Nannocystaceae bacterium]